VHNAEDSTRNSDLFQQAQQIADAAIDSTNRYVRTGVISVCDVDIPFVLADGDVYLQATLPEFHDAVSALMVEFLRNLEARISEARRTTLAHAGDFTLVRVKGVVGEDVV